MSPVIILGLVLMWAVVLVPMWLRRHDEAEESRSVDRFSTAMRTLSRRAPATADGRYVVMPHRTRAVEVHVSGASAPDAGRRGRAGSSRQVAAGTGAKRPLTAAARRRRTLLGLVVGSVLTLVLAVAVGGSPTWVVQLLVDLCLAGFVVHLRQRATRTAAASRQRRRAAVVPDRVVAERPAAAPAPAAARQAWLPAPVAAAVDQGLPVVAEVADAALAQAAELAQSAELAPAAPPAAVAAEHAVPGEAEEAAAAVNGGWEPVPVPRPTYTMKPPAPARRRRKAPLAEPAAEPVAPPAAARQEQAPAEDLDDTVLLEDILTHRRAVND